MQLTTVLLHALAVDLKKFLTPISISRPLQLPQERRKETGAEEGNRSGERKR